MSSIIVLDSSDDESDAAPKLAKSVTPTAPSPSTSSPSSSTSSPSSSTSSPSPSISSPTPSISSPTPSTSSQPPADIESVPRKVLSPRNYVLSPETVLSAAPADDLKRKLESENDKPRKRVKPTLITSVIDRSKYSNTSSPAASFGHDDDTIFAAENEDTPDEGTESDNPQNPDDIPAPGSTKTAEADQRAANAEEENPLTPTFTALLEACRKADPSTDMTTLIDKRLMKYYHSVHPDFVTSKGFCKTVKAVCEQIEASPELVYYQLKTIVEELKVRRKSKSAVMSNEDMVSTGSARRDRQIKMLSGGLVRLTKQIARLEESCVDLDDDDNSAYLQVERLKKNACQIYEKICDLTGESKHAHRAVRKPVTFQGTSYPHFNRTLQSFVNRTNEFPDFIDVLRCLEHCNSQYGFGMRNDEMKKIAQDAFLKIGKLLQNRRKADLYETVAHFTGTKPDPASSDDALSAKLTENQKFHAKIGSLIDRYAKEQEIATAEHKKKDHKKTQSEEAVKILTGNQISQSPLPSSPSTGKAREETRQSPVQQEATTNGKILTTDADRENESDGKIVADSESHPVALQNNENSNTSDKENLMIGSSKTYDGNDDGDDEGHRAMSPIIDKIVQVEEIVISDEDGDS